MSVDKVLVYYKTDYEYQYIKTFMVYTKIESYTIIHIM